MRQALIQAQKARSNDEIPVGAVLVYQGQIVAARGNCVRALKDPSAHAEMMVVRQACSLHRTTHLDDHDLYVTLEPCAMCAAVMSFVRLRRLYFGCYDPKSGGVEHGTRWFEQPTCHHRPEIIGGVEELSSSRLLREFFAERRS